jgi:hypothetical protein
MAISDTIISTLGPIEASKRIWTDLGRPSLIAGTERVACLGLHQLKTAALEVAAGRARGVVLHTTPVQRTRRRLALLIGLAQGFLAPD